jgi:hypothetical protein
VNGEERFASSTAGPKSAKHDSLANGKSDAVVNSVGALQYLISKRYGSAEEMPQGFWHRPIWRSRSRRIARSSGQSTRRFLRSRPTRNGYRSRNDSSAGDWSASGYHAACAGRARQFPARLNSIAWRARARADRPRAGVLRDATVFPRQRASGCFVACRPTPDKKRVPPPYPNWSSNVRSGTRTAWHASGPWQDRVGCDGTSRNCPQTTALPIFPDRDSGPVPPSRREECRSAQPSRQGQANPAAAFAAP